MQASTAKTKPLVSPKLICLLVPHFGLCLYHPLKLKSQAPCWNLPFPPASTANDLLRPLDFTSETMNQSIPLPSSLLPSFPSLWFVPLSLAQIPTTNINTTPCLLQSALNRFVQILQVYPQEGPQWALFFCSLKYQKAFWEQSRKWHQPPCTTFSYLRLRAGYFTASAWTGSAGWRLKACSLWSSSASALVDSC